MRRLQRFFTYLLLLLGSITFLAPLLWMLSTGLKPIDQTMTMPPAWIPYKYFVEKNGGRIEVKPGTSISTPSYVVEIEGGNGRREVELRVADVGLEPQQGAQEQQRRRSSEQR